jgi:tryptophan 2,3-dioxygenase
MNSTADPQLAAELQALLGPGPRREIRMQSDAERIALSAQTQGKPVLDISSHSNAGSTPFIDYINADILHTLAQPRSEHPEEMTFISMGQVMELMFKLLNYEFLRAKAAIRAGDPASMAVILRRTHKVFEFAAEAWGVLSTLTPEGYLAFRDYLGIGSGFESYMYRRLEFVLGNKQPRMLEPHAHVPEAYKTLSAVLTAPSLYDDVIAFLAARGLPIDPGALERDWSQPYRSNAAVRSAWLQIYKERSPGDELYELGETLMDLAERFKIWRYRHFVSVERLIGFKPGTAGTAGTGWLKQILDHNFFPELWEVRFEL